MRQLTNNDIIYNTLMQKFFNENTKIVIKLNNYIYWSRRKHRVYFIYTPKGIALIRDILPILEIEKNTIHTKNLNTAYLYDFTEEYSRRLIEEIKMENYTFNESDRFNNTEIITY